MTHTQHQKQKILAHYQTQELACIQDSLNNPDLTALESIQLLHRKHQIKTNITKTELKEQGRAVN